MPGFQNYLSGCFRKWWYPQIHFNRVFQYRPSILGYPYFWKHPSSTDWWYSGKFLQRISSIRFLFQVGQKTLWISPPFFPWEKMWAVAPKNPTTVNLLVVSTHLKNVSQIGNLPQIRVKMKNIWNHHLVKLFLWIWINPTDESSKLYGNLVHGKHFLKLSMHHRSRVPEPIGGSTKVATGSDGTECQFATSMERTNSNSVKAAILESFLLHLTSSTLRVPQIIGNDGFYARLYHIFFTGGPGWNVTLTIPSCEQKNSQAALGHLQEPSCPLHMTCARFQKQLSLRSVWQPMCSRQIDPVKCWKSTIESFPSMIIMFSFSLEPPRCTKSFEYSMQKWQLGCHCIHRLISQISNLPSANASSWGWPVLHPDLLKRIESALPKEERGPCWFNMSHCFCFNDQPLGIQTPSENGNGLAKEVIVHPNHHLTFGDWIPREPNGPHRTSEF